MHYNIRMSEAFHSTTVAVFETRYRQLLKRIQHLPPQGSRPLTVAGRVAGWITARATSCLAELRGVRVEPEAVHVSASRRHQLPLNAVLESMAFALRDGGCLRSWRGELLDVYGEGRCLGVIERSAMRPLGMLTKAVHLNAWSSDGRLWIARRADTKTTDPGMWDTLVGGLAGAGEDLDSALVRESHEEAGLEPAHLQARQPLRIILRMHRRLPEGYQVEDALVSDCVLPDTAQPRNLDGEVSEFRLVDMKTAWSMVQEGLFTREAELVILDGLMHRQPEDKAAA